MRCNSFRNVQLRVSLHKVWMLQNITKKTKKEGGEGPHKESYGRKKERRK